MTLEEHNIIISQAAKIYRLEQELISIKVKLTDIEKESEESQKLLEEICSVLNSQGHFGNIIDIVKDLLKKERIQ